MSCTAVIDADGGDNVQAGEIGGLRISRHRALNLHKPPNHILHPRTVNQVETVGAICQPQSFAQMPMLVSLARPL